MPSHPSNSYCQDGLWWTVPHAGGNREMGLHSQEAEPRPTQTNKLLLSP